MAEETGQAEGTEQTRAVDQLLSARSKALAGCAQARSRLDALLDPASFVEYGVLAGQTSRVDDDAPGDGLVGGVGEVDANAVVAASYDRSVLDGTQSNRNQHKLAKLIYLAHRNRWPLVLFVDGDGARRDDPLPLPPIVVYSRGRWDIYDGLAELSGWAPTIAVVTGRALDGHAGAALLCDLVIGVRGSFLGSGRGDNATLRSVEEHATRGDIDILVDDDSAAVEVVQNFLSYWSGDRADFNQSPTNDDIAKIVPDNRRRPYDMRKIIHAFADADSVLELGAEWGRSMLTCMARLGGHPIGIFANQPLSPRAGSIDSEAADKASRFVEWCDAYHIPLVSFVDNPGYMVGPDAEREGIARHHARPLSALHHRTVPLYSVQLRKAYGLGPYAMSGFGSSRVTPELRLSWPSVESGGMSLEGAAYLVKRKEIKAAASPQEARSIRDGYAEEMRDVASGVRAGRTYAFDDVITPDETRPRILSMLERVDSTRPGAKKHPIDPR